MEIANKQLDLIGRNILNELQKTGRMPFAELGRRVGLSTPAVMERVRRLEEAGVITGYAASVDRKAIRYPILAFIGINVTGDLLQRVSKLAKNIPEILECHRVTGAHSFLLKVVAGSVEELEVTIDRLTPYVATTTFIVISTQITSSAMVPKEPD